jgi:hypothetical protein
MPTCEADRDLICRQLLDNGSRSKIRLLSNDWNHHLGKSFAAQQQAWL